MVSDALSLDQHSEKDWKGKPKNVLEEIPMMGEPSMLQSGGAISLLPFTRY